MNRTNIFFLTIFFFVCVIIFKDYNYRAELDLKETIHQDSIFNYQNKIGNMYDALEIQQMHIDNLRDSLKIEAKNNKNVIYVTKTKIEVKNDTILKFIPMNVTKHDSIFKINAFYDDEFLHMNNTIITKDSCSYSTLDSLSINADIYHDILLKDNKYYSIIRSNNPYVKINNIDGAFIQDRIKKQRWTLVMGPSLGVDYHGRISAGIGLTFGYKLF